MKISIEPSEPEPRNERLEAPGFCALALKEIAGLIERHPVVVVTIILALCFIPLWPAVNSVQQGDVSHYQTCANDLFDGRLPYKDSLLEYPPYAIPIFAAPRIFGSYSGQYLNSFIMLSILGDFLIKCCLAMTGITHGNKLRGLLPFALYCATTPFLRYFYLQRYDIWPSLICLGAIYLFISGYDLLCGLIIALGIGVKLYPAVFIPVLFVLAFRREKSMRFLGGLTLGLAPIAVLSFFLPWWRFAQFQADRGIQVESTYASVLWLGKWLGLFQVNWTWPNVWAEITGPLVLSLMPLVRLIFIFSMAVSTLVAMRGAAFCQNLSLAELSRLLLMPLLSFIAFNQVFSPQYLVWILPIAVLTSLEGEFWTASLISIAACFTPVIFPSLFGHYRNGYSFSETLILVVRNALLIIALAHLIHNYIRRPSHSGKRNASE